MFKTIWAWLLSFFYGVNTEAKPQLDEFHEATYEELYLAAFKMSTGLDKLDDGAESPLDKLIYTKLPAEDELADRRVLKTSSGKNVIIEFNDEGLGRIVDGDRFGPSIVVRGRLPFVPELNPAMWKRWAGEEFNHAKHKARVERHICKRTPWTPEEQMLKTLLGTPIDPFPGTNTEIS